MRNIGGTTLRVRVLNEIRAREDRCRDYGTHKPSHKIDTFLFCCSSESLSMCHRHDASGAPTNFCQRTRVPYTESITFGKSIAENGVLALSRVRYPQKRQNR